MSIRERAAVLWSDRWIRWPIKFAVVPIAILFGLIFLFDLAIMPAWTRHGDEIVAPELIGRSLGSAQQILETIDGRMEIVERRYSPEFADGTIIEQRPAAGRAIKEGREFKVVISRGSELIEIPRVRGFTERQAELILSEAGFTVGGRAPAQDPSVPVGTVVGTIPDAGARLPRETVVNLLINETESEWAWCPNLVGRNIEEARKILRERKLMMGRVDRRFDDQLLPGTVMSQSVVPGREVRIGTEIDLVISRDR